MVATAWSGDVRAMYQALESQLRARQLAIIEGNFPAEEARIEFRTLAASYRIKFLEIHCTADAETLIARYMARAGSRHAGHVDEQRWPM